MTTRALMIFSLLLASACGYGPSMDLACNDYAQVLCDLHQRCAGGEYYPRSYADRTTCVQRLVLGCTIGATAKDAQRSPLVLEACTKTLADPAFSCADLQANTLPATCHEPGTRPSGAACGISSQCASGFCSNVRTAQCGTCATPPTSGASCATSDCASGQVCRMPAAECDVPIADGGDCVYDGPACAYGLVCTASAKNPSGTCAETTAMLGDSCVSAHCAVEDALSCNSSTHVCGPVPLASDGQACGSLGNGTSALCDDGGLCYLPDDGGISTNGVAGTCKQAAAEGSACDTKLGPQCVSPARCIVTSSTSTAGTCALPVPDACD